MFLLISAIISTPKLSSILIPITSHSHHRLSNISHLNKDRPLFNRITLHSIITDVRPPRQADLVRTATIVQRAPTTANMDGSLLLITPVVHHPQAPHMLV